MIENFQDSLRLVRHLMGFGVEKFAEAIGVTRQTINNLETKKSKMSPTQYIAIAALTDKYFEQNDERFSALRAILDSDGKNYGAEYETAFRDDSLLKRWFEDFIDYGEEDFEEESCDPGELWDLPQEYKIFLDAEIFTREDAVHFVKDLTGFERGIERRRRKSRRAPALDRKVAGGKVRRRVSPSNDFYQANARE